MADKDCCTDNKPVFGSVCSGIEAASVAWHPLGWKAAWLAEIEPFPCAVLAHHYPDTPNYGDMTALPARILAGDVQAPDVFCGGKPGQSYPVAQVGMQVRRLTPRECERLQGFSDDYTLIPYGRPSKVNLDSDFLKYQLRGNPKHLIRDDIGRLAADGPRYKALGNSWAVLCVRWIGRRIDQELKRSAQ